MSRESLREVFEQAAALASSLPEPMQAVAFDRALSLLLATGSERMPPGTETRSRAIKSIPEQSAAKRAPRRVGPQAGIMALLERSFFDEARTTGEIRVFLKHTRGYEYKSKDLAKALLRSVREGVLVRSVNGEGEYLYHRADRASAVPPQRAALSAQLLNEPK